MSTGIALIGGFIYMLFIYLFSGIIVWLVILFYFILLAAIAYFCYWKYNNISDAMDYNEKELNEFLSFDFFQRCGGGIGLTRLIRAMKLSNLLYGWWTTQCALTQRRNGTSACASASRTTNVGRSARSCCGV